MIAVTLARLLSPLPLSSGCKVGFQLSSSGDKYYSCSAMGFANRVVVTDTRVECQLVWLSAWLFGGW